MDADMAEKKAEKKGKKLVLMLVAWLDGLLVYHWVVQKVVE